MGAYDWLLLVFYLMLFLYFVPTFIYSANNGKFSKFEFFLCNLFLGWFPVTWAYCLYVAITSKRKYAPV